MDQLRLRFSNGMELWGPTGMVNPQMPYRLEPNSNKIWYVDGAKTPRQDRIIAVISTAFRDPAKTVRDGAVRTFYRLGSEPLADYAPLIAAFANSPALGDGATAALHTLRSSRQPLPATPLDLCEAFVATHQSDMGDNISTAAGGVTYVVRLTPRMHAQHTDSEIRRRCLDLISTSSSSSAPTTSSRTSTPSNAKALLEFHLAS